MTPSRSTAAMVLLGAALTVAWTVLFSIEIIRCERRQCARSERKIMPRAWTLSGYECICVLE